ncbi:MAG: hypothetical protein Q4B70_04685 [Lachnospiraceae bacterium]|nr:hypothetical protein [Lachnospiraceae bacterium]
MTEWMTEIAGIAFIRSLILFGGLFFVGFGLHLLTRMMAGFLCSVFGNRAGLFIVNRLTFIGTIHHELSHALFAFLTGAKVVEINLLNFSGDSLGNVRFIPRGGRILQAVQRCAAAIAPVACGALTLFLLIQYVNPMYAASNVKWIFYYIEVSIFLHMTLSETDVKTMIKGLPILFCLVFVILCIAIRLGESVL